MRRTYSILILLLLAAPLLAQTVEQQLKAEADRAGSNQAKASAEVAEQLVPVADKQFSEGQSVIGHQTVEEILKYATQARDLALQNRKKMKETEIHLRRCRHALENMRRTLAAEDRPLVQAVEKKLEQFGEDILEAMFAPPKKEQK
jgi:predicted kinase